MREKRARLSTKRTKLVGKERFESDESWKAWYNPPEKTGKLCKVFSPMGEKKTAPISCRNLC